jgi:hypothetical protein
MPCALRICYTREKRQGHTWDIILREERWGHDREGNGTLRQIGNTHARHICCNKEKYTYNFNSGGGGVHVLCFSKEGERTGVQEVQEPYPY